MADTVYDDLVAKAVAKGIDPAVAAAAAEMKLQKEGRSLIEMMPEAAVEKPVPSRSTLVKKAVAKGIAPDVAEAAADAKLEREAQKAFAREAASAKPDFAAATQRAQGLGAEVAQAPQDVLVDMLGPRADTGLSDRAIIESMASSPIEYKPAPAAPNKPRTPSPYGGPNPYELRRIQAEIQKEKNERLGILPLRDLTPAERAEVMSARRSQDVEEAERGTASAAAVGGGTGALLGGALGFRFGGIKGAMLGGTLGAGGLSAVTRRVYRSRTREDQEANLENDYRRPLGMSDAEKDIRTKGLPEGFGNTPEERAYSRLIGGEDADDIDPEKLRPFLQDEDMLSDPKIYTDMAPKIGADVEPLDVGDVVRFWRREAVLQDPQQYVAVGPENDPYKMVARSPEDALLVNPDAFRKRFAAKYPERAEQAEREVSALRAMEATINIPGVDKPLTYAQLVALGSSNATPSGGRIPTFLREVLRRNPEGYAQLAASEPETFRKRATLDAMTMGILPAIEFTGLPEDEYLALARFGQAAQDTDGTIAVNPQMGAHTILELRDTDPATYRDVMADLLRK